MPAIALRGTTVLPGMIVHFDVNRKRSVKAIEAAMMEDQKIFLVTQRNPDIENPGIRDLYQIGTIAFIWVAILLFFGTMVTHDYSMGKNFITILGTVVAMAFIVFIVLLFSMLLAKLVSLVTNIVTELQYRA